jgi:Asp-tRNA(Asn)/Glu-tRNA(Gln) amidotransferase C subunit
MATLEVSAHLRVRPGQMEGFKKHMEQHLKFFSFVNGLDCASSWPIAI